MIGTSSLIGIGIMIAGGLILPVLVCIRWLCAKKEKLTTVLIGAATWFVFAVILEALPKLLFFHPSTSLGKAVLGNTALYTVIGTLLAGIFEETGRFIAFKTVLRKRTNSETAISHGIGHGGFEAMYLMVVPGITYAVYAAMIHAGTFQAVIDQAASAGVDVSGLEALSAQIMAITPITGALSVAERIFAMLIHVGLSIVVFYSVREAKPAFYALAVALHALMDVPAALYQRGILSLYLVEAMLAVYAIVFFVIVYLFLYQRMGNGERSPVDADS